MPAGEVAEETSHGREAPGARRIDLSLGGFRGQPGTEIGGCESCERGQIGLVPEMLDEKAEETGGDPAHTPRP